MRPCIITDEVSQDLETVLRLCHQLRFPAVEIRSVWETPPHRLTLDQCRKVADRARDSGISIAAFCSPVFKTPLPIDRGSIQTARDTLSHALDQCRELRSPLIRVFSFFRDDVPDVSAAAAVLDRILPVSEDVLIVIETGTRTNTPNAEMVQRLIDEVGERRIGVLWDPGNTVFSGFHFEADDCGLADLRPGMLKHVHVKDPAGRREYVELGHGDVPWRNIIRELRKRGYKGYLSLETHWRLDRILTATERDEPWGSNFSDGGLEASARCMATLRDWLDAEMPPA